MFLHPLTFFALFARVAAGSAACMQRLVAPPPGMRPGVGAWPSRRYATEAANDAHYRPQGADIVPFVARLGRGPAAP